MNSSGKAMPLTMNWREENTRARVDSKWATRRGEQGERSKSSRRAWRSKQWRSKTTRALPAAATAATAAHAAAAAHHCSAHHHLTEACHATRGGRDVRNDDHEHEHCTRVGAVTCLHQHSLVHA